MSMRFKTEMFVERARHIHGDKYDYSETNYVRSIDKVVIETFLHLSLIFAVLWYIIVFGW